MPIKNNWKSRPHNLHPFWQFFTGKNVNKKAYFEPLSRRMVLLNGEISKKSADRIVARFLELEAIDKFQDILFCMNSNGGDVKAGMAIYDIMQFTACDVASLCFGQAASMAVLLLAAGTPGKRMALPGARIMFHQPWNGPGDSMMNEDIQIKNMILLKELLNKIIAQHTDGFLKNGFPDDLCGKFFLTAQEAKTFHLIDYIVPLS
ncbi:MAG: ATP-dependent Clp protease proteolytic subunit [Acidobacteria bacterium]|jgi:ATP-dependent Clp protease protease subunit|nr:ATP-dependent Clp protease proteolytic subunit [Acidobacteriota bacterium]